MDASDTDNGSHKRQSPARQSDGVKACADASLQGQTTRDAERRCRMRQGALRRYNAPLDAILNDISTQLREKTEMNHVKTMSKRQPAKGEIGDVFGDVFEWLQGLLSSVKEFFSGILPG